MAQPEWKLIESTDHWQIFEDTTGVYDEEMEYAAEYERDGETRFLLYRFPLEQYKLLVDYFKPGRGILVPADYDKTWPHPAKSYVPWFADDLHEVARSVGAPGEELVEALCSADVQRRAGAYLDIGGYHGFDNFDEYPQDLSVEAWDDRDGKPHRYEVIVGNIGTVYDGGDVDEARKAFHEYVEQSKSGSGRAADESVTILRDGGFFDEHEGATDVEDE